MKKYLPKKVKDIKGAVAIAELRRAHIIITILALSFSLVLLFVSMFEVQLDTTLSVFASVLLVLVALASFVTTLALRKR